jgi:curved DNA-binding protein CbpA
MDYYAILGVERDAAAEAIEQAFRDLARKVHPDLNRGDERAEARMKQLNEIRATLTDPLLRAAYDDQLRRENVAAAPAAARPPVATGGDDVGAAPARRGRATAVFVVLFLLAVAGGLMGPRVWAYLSLFDFRVFHPASSGERPAAEVPAAGPRHGGEPRKTGGRLYPHGERGTVRIGSTADEVIKAFGAPDRVEQGGRAGDAVMVYGTLRLDIANGRVVGGVP